MTYGDFKDLPRRAASEKVLREKAFKIAGSPQYDGYQHRLERIIYIFLDKIS